MTKLNILGGWINLAGDVLPAKPVMKLFKVTTTLNWCGDNREYVNWFDAETEADARDQFDKERLLCDLPPTFVTTFVECDPKTLNPL